MGEKWVMKGVVAGAIMISGGALAEINDGLGGGISNNIKPAVKPVAPMAAPAMAVGNQGKVVSIMTGTGYSYLELESNAQKFWIAGTKVTAKEGDTVQFEQSVVMNGFVSKTLNKTFDQIIFASSVTVVK